MKTITFTIDSKSFLLGALSVGSLLLMFNFKPANQPQTQPDDEVRRYQVEMNEKGTIILDTKTGAYIYDKSYLGNPKWIKGNFDRP